MILAGLLGTPAIAATTLPQERVVVDLATTRHGFRPDEALGAAIDGSEKGEIARLLTAHNIAAMKSAGLRPLTYRLRTELGVEVWHWNPVGRWSDPAHNQGYWTSSDRLGPPIRLSWGYRLPRRGNTVDNATNDDYSRLTDGDRETFWKSNPYLDPAVLHDGQDHPQWLVLRWDRPRPIDSAVIDWGTPFAVGYAVQYWTGATEYDPNGTWVTFPHGAVADGRGGETKLRLADEPITTSHVRILLNQGSGTAPPGATDWRDRLGYAVREVSFGLRRTDGTLADVVVHAASHDGQTFANVSSNDPWHRAVDRNPNLEQAGIDRIFASRLGFGLPVMMPTGLLFDTPENVLAELRYIARRHYRVSQVELGEEPDGQFAEPADYAALYLAMADRAKAVLPGVRFGGPSLQSAFTDLWMGDRPGSWNAGFVGYLARRDRLDALGFVSFEYYPFDDICGDIHAKLIHQSAMLDEIDHRLDSDGLSRSIPRIITEYGFSAYSGRAMSEMPSALLMAGIAGQWLSLGGSAAYMFGYGPSVPVNQHLPCAGFGNMMLHMADPAGQARQPMPSYYTARLLTQIWTLPGHGLHRLVNAQVEGAGAEPEVVAYAVERPDRRLAVLLINRSGSHAHRLVLAKRGADGFAGAADIYSYGPAQYAWLDAGEQSRPARSFPPAHSRQPAGEAITLPPQTLAVVVLAQ
jgi:hypothetical protein